MGTIYYVAKNKCDCCNRYDEEYHIGKSSWGWAFTFQGYKYDGLVSWKKYKEFLKDKLIVDEYGIFIDYDYFVRFVETVKSPDYVRDDGHKNSSHNEEIKKVPSWFDAGHDWADEDGYSFSDREFS
jgi:hypothetical protein